MKLPKTRLLLGPQLPCQSSPREPHKSWPHWRYNEQDGWSNPENPNFLDLESEDTAPDGDLPMGHSTDASAMVSRHRDPNVGKIVFICTYSLNEPRGKRKRQTLSIIIVIIVVIIITIIIIARCHFLDCNVMIPRMMRINDSDNNHYLVNPIINR